MRPHSVAVATTRFAKSGVEHIDVVDKSVFVVVVKVEVDSVVDKLASLDGHLFRTSIAVGCVATVVGHFMAQCDRADDIKRRLELAVRCVFEILACAACRSIEVVVLFVHHVVERLLRILNREFAIGVFHKHYQRMLLSDSRIVGALWLRSVFSASVALEVVIER